MLAVHYHKQLRRSTLISPAAACNIPHPLHTPHIHTMHATHTRTHSIRVEHTACTSYKTPSYSTSQPHTHVQHTHARARANTHTSHTRSGPEHQRIRAPKRRPLPPLPACTARGRVAPLPAHAQQAGAPLPFVIGGQRVPRLSLQFDLEGSLQGQSSTLGRAPQVGRSARRPRTPLLLIPPGAPWPPHLLIAKRSGRV